jgi:predicted dehydrogenase
VDVIGTRGTLKIIGHRIGMPLYHLPYPSLRAGAGEGEWQRLDPPPSPPWDALDASICLMYQELIHAIETGAEHPVNGDVGRHTIEMVLAIYESHRRKSRIELPLQERQHPLERWLEATQANPQA